MRIETTIEQLDEAIEAALDKLTDKQRRYALYLVDGGATTASDAMRKADPKMKPEFANRISWQMNKIALVQDALRLLRHRQELRIGINAGRKRQILLEIADNHKLETPSAAVSAVKELNSMDGHIAPKQIQHGGQVNLVSVDYQLDTGRVLEHDPGPDPLLELITDEVDCDHISDHETLCEDPEWLK